MNITIVGLGLIGGSFAKAFKKHTKHCLCGIDSNPETLSAALKDDAIDKAGGSELLPESDVTIVCLYPDGVIDFIRENAGLFKKGSLVTDACGIKSYIVENCSAALSGTGAYYIGSHPMAGREFSGYSYSLSSLFEGASFIATPTPDIPQEETERLLSLMKEIGFAKTVVTDTTTHDRVIAYTSQLAHIVSNAYVKSPEIAQYSGFSAGSFQDLTRVALLNEDMWTGLFLHNKEPLLTQLDCIIEHLIEYRYAMKESDYDRLHSLLKDGRILKEKSLAALGGKNEK